MPASRPHPGYPFIAYSIGTTGTILKALFRDTKAQNCKGL